MSKRVSKASKRSKPLKSLAARVPKVVVEGEMRLAFRLAEDLSKAKLREKLLKTLMTSPEFDGIDRESVKAEWI